ncbi:acetylglucosamine transferase [Geothrix limicola]|uniref:protein O-GlcNAc transferase n=1 Tax=Geothrix limicola TaxID=2927978 RepID=A0ABQ5QF05_9BACT|nr:glycosyltransferase family 41 protein [Geothrix limicola]GLH73159.1 acetylglucosamine transferase [Geothrix limicola]
MSDPADSPVAPVPETGDWLEAATAAHDKGDLDLAEALYTRILEREPQHAAATHLLGVLKNQRGDHSAAAEWLSRALRLNPRSARVHLNLGIALWQLGRQEEALTHYRYASVLKRDEPEALRHLASALQVLHQQEEALDNWDRYLALAPGDPAALLNRGLALAALDRMEEALASFDQALAECPDFAEVHFQRGFALQELGRLEAARADYEAALRLRPEWEEARLNLAGVLHLEHQDEAALAEVGKVLAQHPDLPAGLLHAGVLRLALHLPAEALVDVDRLLALEPGRVEAHVNRGRALRELQRPLEALASFDKALDLDADHEGALMDRGQILIELRRPPEALASFDHLLSIHPEHLEALLGRGNAQVLLHRNEEALATYTELLGRQPDHVETLVSRGTALHRLGRHVEAVASYDAALALRPDHAVAHSNKIFVMDYLPSLGFEAHQGARRRYYEAQAQRLALEEPVFENDRDPARRLVLGYVSADFKRHSAAACFGPVLRHHDRAEFKVICYSGVLEEDDWTRGFQAGADAWRRTARMPDAELADLIRADGVDVLIDLSGHSEGNRLLVFARRPAPVQVTAWGGGGGTGLPMIDYQFTDPVHIPDWARPLFTETCFDLPCNITFEAPDYAPEVSDLPLRRHGYLTFGCLNRTMKVTPEALALWARLLEAVPGSKLCLKDGLLEDSRVQDDFRARFEGLGIAPDRLLLRGGSSHRDHLAAYGEVDIALDPFPHSGGITTWEALWMGVPVITMPGSKPSSRISGGILHALGLNDWIAESEEAYLHLAIDKASDAAALEGFRETIRARIAASEAGNPVLFTRAVEAAYRTMWRRWLEGRQAQDLGSGHP